MHSIRIFAKNMGDPYYEPTIMVRDLVHLYTTCRDLGACFPPFRKFLRTRLMISAVPINIKFVDCDCSIWVYQS